MVVILMVVIVFLLQMLKKGLDNIDNEHLAIDLSANHDPSLEPFFRTQ